MKILVINGPNLNMLGKRDPEKYGAMTLVQINELLQKKAEEQDMTLIFFQSNHEGEIIDFLQKQNADGILINPGALTHYGYSLRDALIDTGLPIVEVHLSNINKREAFRKIDVLTGVARARIMGQKEQSYIKGFEKLLEVVNHGH